MGRNLSEETAPLASLEQAWRRLRAGEAAPDPDALDHGLLLARDGARAFRVIAGGAAARRLTGAVLGADFASLLAPPARRPQAARLLARAARRSRPTRARLLLPERADHAARRMRLLLLPIRNAAHGETCLIAGLAAEPAPPQPQPQPQPQAQPKVIRL
ncbi:MAG: hypothetical protein ACO27F_10665 [Beijerinckiaceae bacterium]